MQKLHANKQIIDQKVVWERYFFYTPSPFFKMLTSFMDDPIDDICELTLDNMINANVLTYDKKAFVKDAILKKHRHQFEAGEKKHEHKNHHHGRYHSYIT